MDFANVLVRSKKLFLSVAILATHFFCAGLLMAQGAVDIQFARQKITQARLNHGSIPASVQIKFQLDTVNLTPQAYRVEIEYNVVTIYGGDGRGLLYGGLEVAEQIALNKKITETSGKPFIEKRGIKFNIPLDARTPSYDDSGDAAQKNIAEMWNWDFWQEFLDEMAMHRYNTLTLWNPHPFPSMIKLPDYPEVALDDVCVTTLKPLGRENEWGDPQLVTTNVMENLKTIKKISIDQKIAFWRRVMRYAKSRGIAIYYITWNICPNSVAMPVEPFHKTFGIKLRDEKPGKYGITHQMNNPKTVAYYRAAVKTFLLTYPEVEGIGVTAGEYMPHSWEGYNREQWLWQTYGQGILDAKALQPDRTVPFIHRVWYSDMDQIMRYWGQYPDPFEVSFKYSKARLYSSPYPEFAKSHIDAMAPYDLKSWWNLRNDDIFVYRWGDPDFVREFLRFFPEKHTAGYHMGSDGYVWGREFISKNPELSGELEIKKHWYSFMLWGRLGFNDQLPKDFFVKKLAVHYGLADASDLYAAWQIASRIIPRVNQFHWRDWDHMWSVEACMARPVLGGFRSVIDFMDNPTMAGSNLLNPREFVSATMAKKAITKTTPEAVVAELHDNANSTLAKVAELRKTGDISSEYATLLDDMAAMAFLGHYYAEKIQGAVLLAFYEESQAKNYRQEAITHLQKALDYWIAYAQISKANYKPQMLARTNLLDWNAMIHEVKRDIDLAKNK